MGADTEPGRCVGLGDIGEQEQHQERATSRGDVGSPLHEVGLGLPSEADVDMPAAIAGVLGRGKADRERAEAVPTEPASGSHERVEGGVDRRRVHRFAEGRRALLANANDGPRPGRRVALGAPGGFPQHAKSLGGNVTREGLVDAHEAVVEEALEVYHRSVSIAAR